MYVPMALYVPTVKFQSWHPKSLVMLGFCHLSPLVNCEHLGDSYHVLSALTFPMLSKCQTHGVSGE